jgi:hypothetical protein
MASPTEINLVNSASVTWAAGAPYVDPNNPQAMVRDVTATAVATPANFRGAWSVSTAYAVGDVVTQSGSSYICIFANTGNSPPNATYWGLLVSVPILGASGASHQAGIAPDPGATAGATRFLREDATWDAPPSGGGDPFDLMLSPSATLTPPVLASLTWGNQGSASAAANSGGAIYFSCQGAGADNIHHLYKTPPSPPWSLIVGLVPGTNPSGGYLFGGIALRDGTGGKLVTIMGGQGSGGQPWLAVWKYNGYSSSNGAYIQGNCNWGAPVIWLKVSDDGTNYNFYVAIDGQNFKRILQKARTDFLAAVANQVGIFIDSLDNTYLTDALFVHWAGI